MEHRLAFTLLVTSLLPSCFFDAIGTGQQGGGGPGQGGATSSASEVGGSTSTSGGDGTGGAGGALVGGSGGEGGQPPVLCGNGVLDANEECDQPENCTNCLVSGASPCLGAEGLSFGAATVGTTLGSPVTVGPGGNFDDAGCAERDGARPAKLYRFDMGPVATGLRVDVNGHTPDGLDDPIVWIYKGCTPSPLTCAGDADTDPETAQIGVQPPYTIVYVAFAEYGSGNAGGDFQYTVTFEN
jgi:hypothetical protein